jgi:hypothetical protein
MRMRITSLCETRGNRVLRFLFVASFFLHYSHPTITAAVSLSLSGRSDRAMRSRGEDDFLFLAFHWEHGS